MNCWIAFGIGLVIGLLPLIYGIFRAMKMVGGDISNFNWTDVKANQNDDKDLNTVPTKDVKD